MEPIKCWVAQDDEPGNDVYCYGVKEPIKNSGCWEPPLTYMLGINLIGQSKEPVKCVIITEEEYKRLKNKGVNQ